jgi:hypothetical protein
LPPLPTSRLYRCWKEARSCSSLNMAVTSTPRSSSSSFGFGLLESGRLPFEVTGLLLYSLELGRIGWYSNAVSYILSGGGSRMLILRHWGLLFWGANSCCESSHFCLGGRLARKCLLSPGKAETLTSALRSTGFGGRAGRYKLLIINIMTF